jgi:hypothetical protein
MTLLGATVLAQSIARCGIEMQGNAMFIKGTIGNSKPIDLVIDSGSIRTSLDETLATRLGFDLSLKAQSGGGNGRQEISVLRDVEVSLCGKSVTDPVVVVYPLGFLSKAVRRQVDGIVGIEIFRRYVVVLDYPGRSLEVIEPQSFSYSGSGIAVPVLYDQRLPYLSGSVTPFGSDAIPVRLMVDSGGSAFNVDFYHPFEEKHHLVASLRDVAGTTATMFTGERPGTRGRVQSLRIGELTVIEPEVQVLSQSKGGEFKGWDGTLGSGFLKQFKVIFDLPHDRIIFERPAAASAVLSK